MPSPPSLSYPAAQVRRYDRDRFVTGLFAPPEQREDLYALYAFNLEMAKLREVVREPMMGQIRLQWWRDAVSAMAQGAAAPPHPVAEPLAGVVRRHGLDEVLLQRLIDGREADLDDGPPADMAALLRYAEDTAATLSQLGLAVLGAVHPASGDAARQVGIAWALTGLLRAVPFHAALGRVALPHALLAAHGVNAGALLAGKPQPGLAAVAREIAAAARHHLAAARALRPQVERRALPVLLPARLASRYLAALERAGHDLLDTAWSVPRPRPVLLAASALLRRW